MTAITISIWMNPPIVLAVTIPNNHKTTNIIAIVCNIISRPSFFILFDVLLSAT